MKNFLNKTQRIYRLLEKKNGKRVQQWAFGLAGVCGKQLTPQILDKITNAGRKFS